MTLWGALLAGCGSDGSSGPGGGSGGANSGEEPLPEPRVTSFSPSAGPWGTNVTIEGSDLGGTPTFESGHTVRQYTLSTPTQRGFRMPFPAEGAVSLESSWWSVGVGEFTPTWQLAGSVRVPATATVLSAVSRAARRISVLFSGDPAVVLHLEGGELLEETIVFPSATSLSERRLYLTEDGELRAFAVTTGSPRRILDARRSSAGEWTVESTGIEATQDSEEDLVVAGGRGGGVVWFRTWVDDSPGAGGAAGGSNDVDTAAWMRARSVDGSWEVDAGPIVDPAFGRKSYAAGATSDGSLYVAQAVDASTLFDSMEQPRMRRLSPHGTQFGPLLEVGTRVDDSVSAIFLADRGEGLVVSYCGRDVGVISAPTESCYEGLAPAEGTWVTRVPRESGSTHHALTLTTAASFVCENDDLALQLHSADTEEPVAWPCPSVVASAIDPTGELVALVRIEDQLRGFLPRSSN